MARPACTVTARSVVGIRGGRPLAASPTTASGVQLQTEVRAFEFLRCPLAPVRHRAQGASENLGPPLGDIPGYLLEPRVVDLEGLSGQTGEGRQRVAQGGGVEAGVLGVRQFAQSIEAVATRQDLDVDEVTGFGAREERQQLVGGELLAGEDRPERPGLGWEQAGVVAEVDLRAVVGAADLEAHEALAHLQAADIEPRFGERRLQVGKDAGDGAGIGGEEVEVAGGAGDRSRDDEGRAAGQSQLGRFGELETIEAMRVCSALSTPARGPSAPGATRPTPR